METAGGEEPGIAEARNVQQSVIEGSELQEELQFQLSGYVINEIRSGSPEWGDLPLDEQIARLRAAARRADKLVYPEGPLRPEFTSHDDA